MKIYKQNKNNFSKKYSKIYGSKKPYVRPQDKSYNLLNEVCSLADGGKISK